MRARASILSLAVALCGSGCDHAKNYINSDVEPITVEQLRPLRALVDAGELENAEVR